MSTVDEWRSVLEDFENVGEKYRWRVVLLHEQEGGQIVRRSISEWGGDNAGQPWRSDEAEQITGFPSRRAGELLVRLPKAVIATIPKAVLEDPRPERRWFLALPYLLPLKEKKISGFVDFPEIGPDDDYQYVLENAAMVSAVAIRHILRPKANKKNIPAAQRRFDRNEWAYREAQDPNTSFDEIAKKSVRLYGHKLGFKNDDSARMTIKRYRKANNLPELPPRSPGIKPKKRPR
jgi:hypothetical protein